MYIYIYNIHVTLCSIVLYYTTCSVVVCNSMQCRITRGSREGGNICVYIYIYITYIPIVIHSYIHIYIYIYREREIYIYKYIGIYT